MKQLTAHFNRLIPFLRNESGAVTVDWVVGAGAGVLLAIAIANTVGDATHDTSKVIGETMLNKGIKTY